MCGRFVAATDPEGLTRFFVIDERRSADLPPSYNVAPTQQVHAVAEHGDHRYLVAFRWGLVPGWADDPRIGSRLINARAETAADRPAFRDALTRRRCLVPADGFYEWRLHPDGGKVPYYIHSRGGTPLALAGLWDTWRNPADTRAEPLRTFALLTTEAAGELRQLHHRMPVILPPDRWDAWLDRSERDPARAASLLHPPLDDSLDWHPVGPEVNHPANDHRGLILPAPDRGVR